MKKIFFPIIGIIIALAGCSSPQAENGILWDYPLSSEIVAGIEAYNNKLFLGTKNGKIKALWQSSGFADWEATINNEEIALIYAGAEGVLIISTNAAEAKLRKYSFTTGTLETNVSISVFPSGNYLYDSGASGGDRLIIPGGNQFASIKLSDLSISYRPTELQNIKKIVRIEMGVNNFNYFAIDQTGKIQYFDNLLQPIGVSDTIEGITFYGSALGVLTTTGKYIYIGHSGGVDIFNANTLQFEPKLTDKKVKYSAMGWNVLDRKLYIGFSDNNYPEVAKYNPENNSREWIYKNFDTISYSPIVVSPALNTVLFVDDGGYLNVLDNEKGALLHSDFIGFIEKPFLKAPMNLMEDRVFIPITPFSTKVVCYSLDHAREQINK
jgi:hypothetical protein